MRTRPIFVSDLGLHLKSTRILLLGCGRSTALDPIFSEGS
nr:MAG TPA: hypothetical protein [Bacteriophage sp.]